MKRSIILVSIILVYFIFTSGFVYEVTKNDNVETMDTPFSISFSNDRIGFVGIYNQNDIDCAKWIMKNGDIKYPICVDYLGMSLLIDNYGYDRQTYNIPKGKYYLLLLTWNTENQKMVYGWIEASRVYAEIPDLSKATLLYSSGKAMVYEVNN